MKYNPEHLYISKIDSIQLLNLTVVNKLVTIKNTERNTIWIRLLLKDINEYISWLVF